MEIAKRALDAYNRLDVDAFTDLTTVDFEWSTSVVAAVEGGSFRGREGIETYFREVSDTWEEVSTPPLTRSAISATACWCSDGLRDAGGAAASRSMPRKGSSTTFVLARSRASVRISITARRCGRRVSPSRGQVPVSGVRPRSASARSRLPRRPATRTRRKPVPIDHERGVADSQSATPCRVLLRVL